MELKKVSAAKAGDILVDIELSEEAMQLLNGDVTPAVYFQLLVDASLTHDAIKFLARAMPRREATWWACFSARQAVSDDTTVEELKTLELAEQWVYKPTDENRYAVHRSVERLPNETSIYWSAMASFWSGGSIVPLDIPEVQPADHICSLAVAGAVTLAGLAGESPQPEKRYELFIKQGLAIANGENAKEISL